MVFVSFLEQLGYNWAVTVFVFVMVDLVYLMLAMNRLKISGLVVWVNNNQSHCQDHPGYFDLGQYLAVDWTDWNWKDYTVMKRRLYLAVDAVYGVDVVSD